MPVTPFGVGDWVSDFSLPSASGKPVKLSDSVGVPVVLLFVGDDPGLASTFCTEFAKQRERLAVLNTQVLAIRRGAAGIDALGGPELVPAAPAGSWPAEESLPFPLLTDAGGEVSVRYGAQKPRGVLLSPSGRVYRFYDGLEPARLADAMLSDIDSIVNLEPPRQILQQAPIVLIPDVLPPEFCKKLMDVWETQGNADSGFMVNEGDKTIGKFDYNSKIRRDHFIPRGNEIDREARAWIGKHVVGEIFKAFNYEVTRLEDMKIACYDASRGGYFRPHRDNTTGATAHRRFAVSVLLNDDYEGGFLRFPEYGPHIYRPKAGGAAVFGCSLLHEATDVTAGRRFVLLTFLYGEKEAKLREEYAKKTGGGYRS
jgi:peroxiredoxin/predicted 2-oxoglutarate/Fe(II)-dependent dioxygenase YbiX